MGVTERSWLSWSVAIVTITGAAYWVMKDLMPRTDPFSVLGHPWQPHASPRMSWSRPCSSSVSA